LQPWHEKLENPSCELEFDSFSLIGGAWSGTLKRIRGPHKPLVCDWERHARSSSPLHLLRHLVTRASSARRQAEDSAWPSGSAPQASYPLARVRGVGPGRGERVSQCSSVSPRPGRRRRPERQRIFSLFAKLSLFSGNRRKERKRSPPNGACRMKGRKVEMSQQRFHAASTSGAVSLQPVPLLARESL
jgi:hypothetical protein